RHDVQHPQGILAGDQSQTLPETSCRQIRHALTPPRCTRRDAGVFVPPESPMLWEDFRHIRVEAENGMSGVLQLVEEPCASLRAKIAHRTSCPLNLRVPFENSLLLQVRRS